jgi:hypothetical protein
MVKSHEGFGLGFSMRSMVLHSAQSFLLCNTHVCPLGAT